MPQLELQQNWSLVQTVSPHLPSCEGQTSNVQPAPGSTQVPQLSLQHTSPASHTVLPHFCPSGTQASCVHCFPGSTQTPQLSLQHSNPASQTTCPHCASLGAASLGQTWAVHAMPGFTQMPQDGLQQDSPASHTVLPHSTPLMHWATPSISLQVVPASHRTRLQVVFEDEPALIGLPMTLVAAKRATSRPREREIIAIMFDTEVGCCMRWW